MNFRAGWLGMPYGDQGFMISRFFVLCIGGDLYIYIERERESYVYVCGECWFLLNLLFKKKKNRYMFDKVGGFEKVPFMEDVTMVRKLRGQFSTNVTLSADTSALTSSRR